MEGRDSERGSEFEPLSELRIHVPSSGVPASPSGRSSAHDNTPTTGGFDIKDTTFGSQFVDPRIEEAAKYQWFLSQARLTVLCLVGLFEAHVLWLVRELAKVAPIPEYMAAFVIYDSIVFCFIIILLWRMYATLKKEGLLVNTHRGRIAGRCRARSSFLHALMGAVKRTKERVKADPRTIKAPTFIASMHQELLMALILFLAANRAAFLTAVVCPATATWTPEGSVAATYQPCRVIAIGGYPFPPFGTLLIAGSIYSAILALSETWLVIGLTCCYASVVTIELGVNYGIIGRLQAPQADDTVTTLVILSIAFILHVMIGLNRMALWRTDRASIMASRDFHLEQQTAAMRVSAAEAARLKWKARVQVAIEMSYETLSAYAAHELRNPLHVLLAASGAASENAHILQGEMADASHPIKERLHAIIQDQDVVGTRLNIMQRIVYDLTDFWQLRAGMLVLWPVITALNDLTAVIERNALDVSSNKAPSTLVVDTALPSSLLVEKRRIGQLTADLCAHAAASGSTAVRSYIFLLDTEQVWPQRDRSSPNKSPISQLDEANSFLHTGHSQMSPLRPTCRCDIEARMPGSASHRQLSKSWICIVVVADNMMPAPGIEAMTADPVGAMVEQLAMSVSGTPNTPLSRDVTIPVTAGVHASSLSLAVAKMLSRRLGGDMLVFEDSPGDITSPATESKHAPPAGTSCSLQETIRRFYLTMLPLVNEQQASQLHMGIRLPTCGVYTDVCPHCGLRTTSAEAMQAATMLFASGGRIPPKVRRTLKEHVVSAINRLQAEWEFPSLFNGGMHSRPPQTSRGSGQVSDRGVPFVSVQVGPAKATTSTVTPSIPSSANSSTNGSGRTPPKRKLNVLYVDDEGSNRLLMGRFLRRLGHSVVILDDGIYVGLELQKRGMLTRQQAEEVQLPCDVAGSRTEVRSDTATPSTAESETRPFDVILLDIVMPHLDGASVCMALRKIDTQLWRNLPIIAATGNAPHEGALLDAGFTSVLPKPFSVHELQDMLNRIT